MKQFIPYEKLSKKAKRQQDQKRRAIWQMNPVTRKTDKNAYDRKKIRQDVDQHTYAGFCFTCAF
ncbi:hypothetical protein LJC27_00575 [Christensenellaceae bacterium OttesenSCG-928-M15]|nr:hypothetical protein [Christensenellaceae bacterium OttesenSCG-928-M15]